MYKTRKKVVLIGIYVLAIVLFLFVCFSLLPQRNTDNYANVTFVVVFAIFVGITFWANRTRHFLLARVRKETLESGETVSVIHSKIFM